MSDNKDSKPKTRRDLIRERNKKIREEYLSTFGSLTVEKLAKKYGMSKNNLYLIIRKGYKK